MDRNDVIRPAIDVFLASLSARRAWIEIFEQAEEKAYLDKSLSARRAWIEICYLDNIEITEAVALRKESVDRNFSHSLNLPSSPVVALRKESVDRNESRTYGRCVLRMSLSARRAWIEIFALLVGTNIA